MAEGMEDGVGVGSMLAGAEGDNVEEDVAVVDAMSGTDGDADADADVFLVDVLDCAPVASDADLDSRSILMMRWCQLLYPHVQSFIVRVRRSGCHG